MMTTATAMAMCPVSIQSQLGQLQPMDSLPITVRFVPRLWLLSILEGHILHLVFGSSPVHLMLW
jgi:hypothetical protein